MAEMWKLKCEKCGAEVHLEHSRVQVEPDEYTGELAAAGVLCPFHGGSRYLLRPIATCNREPSAPYHSHQWGMVGSNAVCLLCDALEHAHNRSASGLEADGRSVFEAGDLQREGPDRLARHEAHGAPQARRDDGGGAGEAPRR